MTFLSFLRGQNRRLPRSSPFFLIRVLPVIWVDRELRPIIILDGGNLGNLVRFRRIYRLRGFEAVSGLGGCLLAVDFAAFAATGPIKDDDQTVGTIPAKVRPGQPKLDPWDEPDHEDSVHDRRGGQDL